MIWLIVIIIASIAWGAYTANMTEVERANKAFETVVYPIVGCFYFAMFGISIWIGWILLTFVFHLLFG